MEEKEHLDSAESQAVEEKKSSSHITIRIWSQDGDLFFARINRQSKLRKLMAAHMRYKPLDDLGTYDYLLDGRNIRGSQTAAEVGLEDGDQIDAMVRQRGGGSGLVINDDR